MIERLDPIYADFTISQDKLTAVQAEMRSGSLKTEIRLPDSNGEMVAGQLTFLDNAVQNTTGLVACRGQQDHNVLEVLRVVVIAREAVPASRRRT